MIYYPLLLFKTDILQFLGYLMGLLYLVIILWLALYGISNLVNAFLYLRIKKTIQRQGTYITSKRMAAGNHPAPDLQ